MQGSNGEGWFTVLMLCSVSVVKVCVWGGGGRGCNLLL